MGNSDYLLVSLKKIDFCTADNQQFSTLQFAVTPYHLPKTFVVMLTAAHRPHSYEVAPLALAQAKTRLVPCASSGRADIRRVN